MLMVARCRLRCASHACNSRGPRCRDRASVDHRDGGSAARWLQSRQYSTNSRVWWISGFIARHLAAAGGTASWSAALQWRFRLSITRSSRSTVGWRSSTTCLIHCIQSTRERCRIRAQCRSAEPRPTARVSAGSLAKHDAPYLLYDTVGGGFAMAIGRDAQRMPLG